MITPVLIEKEDIIKLKFPSSEVLSSTIDLVKRRKDIDSAMRLGNGFKGKSKIIFESTEGLKVVETTVWAATEDSVVLKGGINIPLRCVKEILI